MVREALVSSVSLPLLRDALRARGIDRVSAIGDERISAAVRTWERGDGREASISAAPPNGAAV